MDDLQALTTILKSLDSLVALGIAVWIINIGIKQINTLQDKYTENVKAVMAQQHDDNRALMGLVKDLCEQRGQPVTVPKAAKNGQGLD